jgi:hypothetical protein
MIPAEISRLKHKIARLEKEAQEYAYLAQERRRQLVWLTQEVARLERPHIPPPTDDPR